MKTSLIFILTFLNLSVHSQDLEIDKETGKYTHQQIIQVDGINRDQMFSKALEWIALNYNSAQDVLQLSDKESGKIICKGNFATNLFMKDGWINHTLILEFKENRYRQTYTDFSYYSTESGEMRFESKNLGFKKKIFKTTTENIEASTENLKQSMFEITSEDDW